jgi:hypothetical protein
VERDGGCQRLHIHAAADALPAYVRRFRQCALFYLSHVHFQAAEAGVAAKPGFRKHVVPVRHCRTIARRDMVLDSATPRLEVDPETYEVRAGPVGSAKTALVDRLSPRLADRLSIAAVTNDIYTREDAGFLIRVGAQTSKHFGSLTHARAGGCGFHREWRR